METSPNKNKPISSSSRVIDSLHSEIDSLKSELESTKISNNNNKKKYEISQQKNDLFVDQLANAKHENDMINALLTRKERRIVDLETQYNEVMSTNDSLTLNNKSMKIRCDNLQESSALSTAEYERLKIAYDALKASQLEYKKHYEQEVQLLTNDLANYKAETLDKFQGLSLKLNNNDKDVDTLLDGLTNKRKTLDNLYFNKNKLVIDLLSKLASVGKIQGQDCKLILQDNVHNIELLREKYPDLPMKLNAEENVEINLDDILNESNEVINSSFDEEATLINSPPDHHHHHHHHHHHQEQPAPLKKQNTLSNKKRKNKRASMRHDKPGEKDNSSRARTPTPPTHNTHSEKNFNNNSSRNSSLSSANFPANNNSQHNKHHHINNNNKGKRRSMYGNNNYNANADVNAKNIEGKDIPINT